MWIRDVAAWVAQSRGRRLLLFGLLMVGCASTQHAGERGLPEPEGTASYYAQKFVGRTTANGEIYDPEALTAAHLSLPFGTRVRVTRVDHAEAPSVVVRINDRGPFKRGRIIDLSKTAAQRIEMIREGVVEVRLEVVSYPEGGTAPRAEASEPTRPDPGW